MMKEYEQNFKSQIDGLKFNAQRLLDKEAQGQVLTNEENAFLNKVVEANETGVYEEALGQAETFRTLDQGNFYKEIATRMDLEHGKLGFAQHYLANLKTPDGVPVGNIFQLEKGIARDNNGSVADSDSLFIVNRNTGEKFLIENEVDMQTFGDLINTLPVAGALGGMATAGPAGAAVGNLLGHTAQGIVSASLKYKEGYQRDPLSVSSEIGKEIGWGVGENFAGNFIGRGLQAGAEVAAPALKPFIEKVSTSVIGNQIGAAFTKLSSKVPLSKLVTGMNETATRMANDFSKTVSGQIVTGEANPFQLAGAALSGGRSVVKEAIRDLNPAAADAPKGVSQAFADDFNSFRDTLNQSIDDINKSFNNTLTNLKFTLPGTLKNIDINPVFDDLGKIPTMLKEYGDIYGKQLGKASIGNFSDTTFSGVKDSALLAKQTAESVADDIANLSNKQAQFNQRKIADESLIQEKRLSFQKDETLSGSQSREGLINTQRTLAEENLANQKLRQEDLTNFTNETLDLQKQKKDLDINADLEALYPGTGNIEQAGIDLQQGYQREYLVSKKKIDSLYKEAESLSQFDVAPDPAIQEAGQEYVDRVHKMQDELLTRFGDQIGESPYEATSVLLQDYLPGKLETGADFYKINSRLVNDAMSATDPMRKYAAQQLKSFFKSGDNALMDQLLISTKSPTVRKIAEGDRAYAEFKDVFDQNSRYDIPGAFSDVQTNPNTIRNRNTAPVTAQNVGEKTLADSRFGSQYETVTGDPRAISDAQNAALFSKVEADPTKAGRYTSNPNVIDSEYSNSLQNTVDDFYTKKEDLGQSILSNRQSTNVAKNETRFANKADDLDLQSQVDLLKNEGTTAEALGKIQNENLLNEYAKGIKSQQQAEADLLSQGIDDATTQYTGSKSALEEQLNDARNQLAGIQKSASSINPKVIDANPSLQFEEPSTASGLGVLLSQQGDEYWDALTGNKKKVPLKGGVSFYTDPQGNPLPELNYGGR